jgi:hypothetical protein
MEVLASAESTEPVLVRLARGATIAGRVRDPEGEPCSRATVSAQRSGSPFSTPQTATSADGVFRLDHVSAGEVALWARHASDSSLQARSTLLVAEGSTESVEIVLASVPHIRGRAEDGAGNALVGWEVVAHSQGLGGMSVSSSSETDDEGEFLVLVRQPADSWTLELSREGVVHDRAEGARAGDEIVLVAPGQEALGRIAGTFVDAAARVPAGARVTARLVLEDGESHSPAELVNGRFAFESVLPGRYRVHVRTADSGLADSDVFDLQAGANVDVGVLASRGTGSLAVEFLAPSDVALPEGCAFVDGLRPLVRADQEWRVAEMEAGAHWLSTAFPQLGMEQRRFEIEEGRETNLIVELERGVERTLVFTPAPGIPCSSVGVTLRTADWELACPVFGAERLELTLTLSPGVYTIEAAGDAGLGARGVLEIPDLTVTSAEVVYVLR